MGLALRSLTTKVTMDTVKFDHSHEFLFGEVAEIGEEEIIDWRPTKKVLNLSGIMPKVNLNASETRARTL